jgi:Smg protein
MLEILLYLFENYLGTEQELVSDPDTVRVELLEAGFPPPEVSKAFAWLEPLAEENVLLSGTPSQRIFAPQEMERIDVECRGLIIHLEQSGILSPNSRELVIDRLLALDETILTLENLKWVVLMVLFSQPEEELAFAQMENLIYDNWTATRH